MRFKNLSDSNLRGQKKIYEQVSYFSVLAKKSLSSGWRVYCGLDRDSRTALRNFRSTKNILDFPRYLLAVQNSRPCGMADKWDKIKLVEMVNEELLTFSSRERRRYLNGKLLTFEV